MTPLGTGAGDYWATFGLGHPHRRSDRQYRARELGEIRLFLGFLGWGHVLDNCIVCGVDWV